MYFLGNSPEMYSRARMSRAYFVLACGETVYDFPREALDAVNEHKTQCGLCSRVMAGNKIEVRKRRIYRNFASFRPDENGVALEHTGVIFVTPFLPSPKILERIMYGTLILNEDDDSYKMPARGE